MSKKEDNEHETALRFFRHGIKEAIKRLEASKPKESYHCATQALKIFLESKQVEHEKAVRKLERQRRREY